jgi:hypothetical protein
VIGANFNVPLFIAVTTNDLISAWSFSLAASVPLMSGEASQWSRPCEVEAVLEGEQDSTVTPMELAELYGMVTQGQYEFGAHAQRERLADA